MFSTSTYSVLPTCPERENGIETEKTANGPREKSYSKREREMRDTTEPVTIKNKR